MTKRVALFAVLALGALAGASWFWLATRPVEIRWKLKPGQETRWRHVTEWEVLHVDEGRTERVHHDDVMIASLVEAVEADGTAKIVSRYDGIAGTSDGIREILENARPWRWRMTARGELIVDPQDVGGLFEAHLRSLPEGRVRDDARQKGPAAFGAERAEFDSFSESFVLPDRPVRLWDTWVTTCTWHTTSDRLYTHRYRLCGLDGSIATIERIAEERVVSHGPPVPNLDFSAPIERVTARFDIARGLLIEQRKERRWSLRAFGKMTSSRSTETWTLVQ